mgnify:CR=1 FL=1|tara:strand:+ start:14 stop:547 length:534 start_codon:yes stop_codon:yes gene_type:complete
MLQKKINRNPKNFPVYYSYRKKIFKIDLKSFYKIYKCHKIIKFHKNEFDLIKSDIKILTHFNIQDNAHIPNRKYLLVKIFKPGLLNKKINKPPILDLRYSFLTKCLYSKSNVPYEKLNKENFKYSLKTIKSIRSLKKTILKRYKKSLAYLSESHKLSLGVGITTVKILDKIKQKKLI